MIELEYNFQDHGWASGKISNAKDEIIFDISYLNDSLKELAVSAIELKDKETKSVVFMSEPGEHILKLSKSQNGKLNYELRWYKDWFSWNLLAETNYKVVLEGETTLVKYKNQVRNILIKIHDKIGPIDYKKRWILNDFPIEEYELLK